MPAHAQPLRASRHPTGRSGRLVCASDTTASLACAPGPRSRRWPNPRTTPRSRPIGRVSSRRRRPDRGESGRSVRLRAGESDSAESHDRSTGGERGRRPAPDVTFELFTRLVPNYCMRHRQRGEPGTGDTAGQSDDATHSQSAEPSGETRAPVTRHGFPPLAARPRGRVYGKRTPRHSAPDCAFRETPGDSRRDGSGKR